MHSDNRVKTRKVCVKLTAIAIVILAGCHVGTETRSTNLFKQAMVGYSSSKPTLVVQNDTSTKHNNEFNSNATTTRPNNTFHQQKQQGRPPPAAASTGADEIHPLSGTAAAPPPHVNNSIPHMVVNMSGLQYITSSIVMPSNITGHNISSYPNPLKNCKPTSQIKIFFTSPKWTMVTLDEDGNHKSHGGDEFYITYEDFNDPAFNKVEVSAVSIPTHVGNGIYQLEFVSSPVRYDEDPKESYTDAAGRGVLTIYYQYTCGMGELARPYKKHWKDCGTSRSSTQLYNVSSPIIRKFVPPNISVNLASYKKVICFGDSIMNNLCGMYWNKFRVRKPNVYCHGNVGVEYALGTVDGLYAKLVDWHHKDLQAAANTSSSTVALLLGSAVWDILEPRSKSHQGQYFEDHIQACKKMIESVRANYPNVDIVWKSPQGLHVQALKPPCFEDWNCIKRTKYMSSTLAQVLWKQQKKLMDELNVPFVDLYEASSLSADQLMPGDGRHYRYLINEKMMDFMYS